jgi:hypothetical protein
MPEVSARVAQNEYLSQFPPFDAHESITHEEAEHFSVCFPKILAEKHGASGI